MTNTTHRKSRRLRLGRSAIVGLRLGAFFVGLAAAIALAVIGWNAYQSRTGLPGGELLIIPAFAVCFYLGWVFREEWAAWKRRRKERGAYGTHRPKRGSATPERQS